MMGRKMMVMMTVTFLRQGLKDEKWGNEVRALFLWGVGGTL